MFSGSDAISLDHNDGIMDRLQWPLDVQQTVDKASAAAYGEGLPDITQRLARVTYTSGKARKAYVAYAELGAIDALGAVIHSQLRGEVVRVDLGDTSRALNEMVAAHGRDILGEEFREQAAHTGMGQSATPDLKPDSAVCFHPDILGQEQTALSGFNFGPSVAALDRLSSQVPFNAFAIRSLLAKGIVPAFRDKGAYTVCSTILQAYAGSEVERARFTAEAIRKQVSRLPEVVQTAILDIAEQAHHRIDLTSGKRTLRPRLALTDEAVRGLEGKGITVALIQPERWSGAPYVAPGIVLKLVSHDEGKRLMREGTATRLAELTPDQR